MFTECTVCSVVFVLQKYKHIWFLLLHEKIQMQTDLEEEQSQGDGQNETEEKTTQENEEIEVRSLIFFLLLLLLKKDYTSLFPVTAWIKPVKPETREILLLYYANCC